MTRRRGVGAVVRAGLSVALVAGALVAPALALPERGATNRVIEAPPPPKAGIGLVLLVSLQRA